MSLKTNICITFTLLVSAACGADMEGAKTEAAMAEEEVALGDEAATVADLGIDGDATFRSWTGYTSEEFAPLECASNRLIRGMDCEGSFCDNVRADCVTASVTTGESSWTSYFSEEGSGDADQRICPGNEFVTGFTCKDSYCDKVSLECSLVSGRTKGNCAWSSWYSDEDGPWTAPNGRFLVGVECDGSFCDNMRYRFCAAN